MSQSTRVSGSLLALFVIAGAIAPTTAAASSFGSFFHLHPSAAKRDGRILLYLRNDDKMFQDVEVDGHVYTVHPHEFLSITAPSGTKVYAGSKGLAHHKGDMLFAVTPELQGKTVSLD